MMIKTSNILRWLALASMWLAQTAHADLPASVVAVLEKAGIPQSHVSAYVQAVDSRAPLLEHNAHRAMNPASVMKLVTTYAGLDILGPAFRWKTEVYRDGEIRDGTLHGNLIIKGYGDPSFKAHDFRRLLTRVRQAGIQRINGNFIIDKTYFASSVSRQRNFDSEKWRAYNASPSALLVNGRNTSFRFSVLDGKVLVDQEFALSQVKIVNNMQLKKGGCGSWRNHYTYDVTAHKGGATVSFTGKFSEKCGTRYLELSVMNDAQYAYYTFKKLWKELGGAFAGRLQVKPVPEQATEVVTQVSQPLSYVINDLNKWSINVMARQLLLTIAAEQTQLPATEAEGEIAVKSWLASKGLGFNSLVIENGSGLSRIERINAQELGQMLVSAYRGPVMSELISSMAISGLDGTVKKRFRKSPVKGYAHLKTGSLSGVSAIAGYVLDQKGRRYVVVMMVNDKKTWSAKKAQNALIEAVFESI